MSVTVDRDRDFLVAVDVQPTFMPGGELPVERGHEVVPVINRLLDGVFARAVATLDWHPPGHRSFASAHPGRAPFEVVELAYGPQTLWPDHAVQGTANAALHPSLDRTRFEIVIRKGTRRHIDSYSAFFENDGVTPTGLLGALRELDAGRLFFTGLALDYCVAFSAEHAARAGFESYVVTDASRAIAAGLPDGTTSLDRALRRLEAAGVRMIGSDRLRAA